MTESKDMNDMERPRRKFAGLLDRALHCPLCYDPGAEADDMVRALGHHDAMRAIDKLRAAGNHIGATALLAKLPPRPPPPQPAGLRVVTYRRNSVRLECRDCGLRFSIDPAQLADALEGIADRWPGALGPRPGAADYVSELRALDSWSKAASPQRRIVNRRAARDP